MYTFRDDFAHNFALYFEQFISQFVIDIGRWTHRVCFPNFRYEVQILTHDTTHDFPKLFSRFFDRSRTKINIFCSKSCQSTGLRYRASCPKQSFCGFLTLKIEQQTIVTFLLLLTVLPEKVLKKGLHTGTTGFSSGFVQNWIETPTTLIELLPRSINS